MKEKHIFILAFVVFCFVKMCGGCNGCDSGSEDHSDNIPSWLQGTWVLTAPYGTIYKVEIDGDHIRENIDGDVYYGTFRVYDDAIHPNTNSHAYYPLDMSAQKIGDGRGGYFRKQ